MTGRRPDDVTATGVFAAADLPAGSVLAGRFVIEGRLGMGGMGVVYRALDRDLGIVVALKLLRPEFAHRPEAFERFRQELLLARQVSSPRVVRIHDIARDGDRWFISMDYVEGEALDHLLDRRGPLPVDEALAITRQLAEGLRAAHASGIVHRDLKPSNVLMDPAGEARISDFGVARSLGSSGLTQSGGVVGTPDYLSPEQARGGPIDGRSDLYALGLILHEMLGGQPAFGDGTAAESLSRRLVGTPPPVDRLRQDVPAWVQRLLDRLLRPNPAHRFKDATAVLTAIDRRAVPRALRPSFGVLAASGGVLALVFAAAWWAGRDPTPSPVPVAAAPRPARVLVLASTAGGSSDVSLEAVAEHLRLALARDGQRDVADGERISLAMAQAGLGPGAAVDDADLVAVLPASRLLRLEHEATPAGHRFSARLAGTGEPAGAPAEFAGDANADPARAASSLFAKLETTLPGSARATDLLPPGDDGLASFGQGLVDQQQGRLAQATAAYQAGTETAPAHAAGWLALSDAARQAGQRPLALAAARSGLALAGSPLRAEFETRAAWLEGRADDALAMQRQRLAERPGDLAGRRLLAEMELEAGDYEQAVAGLESLLALDEQDPRTWFLLGKAAILRGEPRQAVEQHLVRALVLFKRGRSARGEAETVNALGVGFARLGQVDDAEEQYGKALALRRQLGDVRGTASSLRNLAQVATIRGQFDEARTRLEEAHTLFASLGDDAGGAAVDNELGLLAEERGDYQAALDAYKRGLRGRERAGDAQGMAESLNNVGFAHHQLGDYDNAGALWRQARESFVALDDHNGIVRVDQNLGLLEMARGDWAAARRLLEASLREAESRQMHEEAAVSLRNLAELDWLQGRLAPAHARLQRARALFAERGDQRGSVDADLLLARLLDSAGAGDRALEVLGAAAESLAQGSPEQAAIAALVEAGIHLDAGRRAPARGALARAAARADESGLRALQLQARLLSLEDARDPAVTDLDAAIGQLGNLPVELLWRERLSSLWLAAGEPDAARRAYEQALSRLVGGRSYVRAEMLHRRGAEALAAAGDPPAAARASGEAEAARARRLEQLPAALRASTETPP